MRTVLIGMGCWLALCATVTANAEGAAGSDASGVAALKGEIEQLRSLLPGQSHVMIDVEYHFANLWFAGQAGNWPLANFYLNETRSRVQWALRIRQVRKLASGQDLDLKPLADAFESGGLAQLKAAVAAKDGRAFETAYRATLSQCHGCHVAAEKPFLRPDVPHQPASPLIGPAGDSDLSARRLSDSR